MSGKYLHGLIVDSDFVDVRDNIFSHSELRQKWSLTGSEQPHKNIREWSWDYVTKEFIETPKDLIPTAKKWIKKNLKSHKQLIVWVDRNWEGLANGDERERELHIWRLIDHKAKHKNKLVQNFLKAYANREKAYADKEKAYADWERAYADRKKADADRKRAYANREKAYADWKKAYSDRKKADADWERAYSDWKKADKKWKTCVMKPIFMELLKKYPNKYWKNK